MIEPQSSEIEYRQGRLKAEATNRRLAASQVHREARPATRGRSRRTLGGSVAAVLRNLGVFALLSAALVVGGCSTRQGVSEGMQFAPPPPLAAAPSPPAVSDDPLPAEFHGAPGRAYQR